MHNACRRRTQYERKYTKRNKELPKGQTHGWPDAMSLSKNSKSYIYRSFATTPSADIVKADE